MVLSYISDIIPPTVGNSTHYALLNRANISTLPQRTTLFSQSCIPSSINARNNLSVHYRNYESYDAFCYHLKKDFCSNVKVPVYYLKGNRNNDLFHNHLRDTPFCECLEEIENAEHYFFSCKRFADQRPALFNTARPFHPLNACFLLTGNSNLSYDDNGLLF